MAFFSQRDNEAKNADDVLFDMFRNETTDLLPIGKFLAVSVLSTQSLMSYARYYRIQIQAENIIFIFIISLL